MAWSPLWIGQPASSVSCTATRDTIMTGVSQRSSSSMALGMTSGFSTSWRRCSGCSARKANMQSSVAVTVSSPAIRKRKQMSRMSSRVRRSPSTSALRKCDRRSSLRLLLALVEDLVEVLVDRIGDLLLVRLGLGRPLRRPGHVLGPDDAVLHGEEGVELVHGQAEQGEEDLRGERDGELLGEVHLAPLDEPVDEVVHEVRDLLVHGGHLARGEDRVEQLAELLVLRRVDLQRDHRPLVLEVDGIDVGGEDLGVPKGEVDVLLAREEDARVGADVHGHHRHFVPQHLVRRLRVGRHVGVHGRQRSGVAVPGLVGLGLGLGVGVTCHWSPPN